MYRKTFYSLASVVLLLASCTNLPKAKQNKPAAAVTEQFSIRIHDKAALSLIAPEASFEILATGFKWSEGPLWVDSLQALLFSDVPTNKIYKWSPKDSLGIYLEYAGHTGEGNKDSNKGSNGLMLNRENQLILCQHGDRRIARLNTALNQPKPEFITLADSFNNKPFNSPNDLDIDRDGNIYFTDPPYGQPGTKTAEIGFNGVFKVSPSGGVTMLIDSLNRPNGIALSLNQKTVYINQSDKEKPFLYRYEIATDGSLTNGKVLFDFSRIAKEFKGLPDGLKIHKSGNIFATGPGGVHIISPEGKLLATIVTGKRTANCTFDSYQNYLYTTTTDMLLRIALK
jgi:gluconolactonase